ncbi:hypothetical protein AB6A40_003122 [Gnathostoma spinigerum]|uniref:Actin maturation protease n=1 Tax=Gnathostoma spinigerum TaxID=75299 RepID=A0ABD6E8R3_9BILA
MSVIPIPTSKLHPLVMSRISQIVELHTSERCGGVFILCHETEAVVQSGPQCGIVALVMASRYLKLETTLVGDVLALAKRKGYTSRGEMFSAAWLADLAISLWPSIRVEVLAFPSKSQLVQVISNGSVILVPYDCDKNHEPALFHGHKAHWCVLVGFAVVSSNAKGLQWATKPPDCLEHLYLLCLHGKSKYEGVWSYERLAASNKNLEEIEEKSRGWKTVQRCLPKILEYGRQEGILQIRDEGPAFNITGILLAAQEEAHIREPRNGDKVNLPTNDITMMHEAIPFLPVPVAFVCLTLNIILPGSGTILSGFSALCMGQPRINFKEGRKLVTVVINALVGLSQFFTITFLLVGWFWSIAWGGLIIIHSMQYRDALQQRRQEAVATAAIEALTKDSILHRRDVKTLVKAHQTQSKRKDENVKGRLTTLNVCDK